LDTPLSIRRVELTALHNDPANARTHDQRNLGAITASLQRFGQAEPLVVHKATGRVIGGNGRLVAMRALGWTECDVVEVDVDEMTATALGIALNRTAELADWDLATLGELLGTLRTEDALAGVGFDDDEIDELLAELGLQDGEGEGGEGIADDPVPELPEVPVSRLGDLWILGEHRVLCGDATNPTDVSRLLAGATPRLMVSDPPYGVSYDPNWRNKAGVSSTKRTGAVTNDDRVDWRDAWELFPGDVAYVWHAGKFCGPVAASLDAVKFEIRAQLIWAKSRFALSRGAYHWQHEPCQPPGTLVTLAGGERRPIEQLEDGDRVVSYNTTETIIKRRGRAIRTASREYDGDLYSVEAAGRKTRATDGHKFSVRFAASAAGKQVVYLMRRGTYWRVGHVTMFHSRGFGVSARMAQEGGDEAWVIALKDNRIDAAVLEQIIHCKYGIPTTHWQLNSKHDPSVHRSLEQIDEIYGGIGLDRIDNGARRLLADYGRKIEYPFAVAGDAGAFSRTKVREVRACNLVAGMVQVPIDPGKGARVEWADVIAVTRAPYAGPVHSMEVERDHHYIADGIVTHNCWYAVRKGSKAHWIGDRKQSTVWQIPSTNDGDATIHGTQKPVECMARPMRNHDAAEVYDCFLGSGSSLAAAEHLGRRCYGLEIDPRYVDVTIERWEKLSGKQAVQAGSNTPFAKLRSERLRQSEGATS